MLSNGSKPWAMADAFDIMLLGHAIVQKCIWFYYYIMEMLQKSIVSASWSCFRKEAMNFQEIVNDRGTSLL